MAVIEVVEQIGEDGRGEGEEGKDVVREDGEGERGRCTCIRWAYYGGHRGTRCHQHYVVFARGGKC